MLAKEKESEKSLFLVDGMRDEDYIIGLCDRLLGLHALRRHIFDFLLGDPGCRGQCAKLPVDAHYPELRLVIEYHERQHAERVGFFDDRLTISGMSRGEQRKRYDERRRQVLPANGIHLVELSCNDFRCKAVKRLRRIQAEDSDIIRNRLKEYIPGG